MAGAGAATPARNRLAIIAGGGFLPRHLAEAARAHGEDPLILKLKGEADHAFEGFESVDFAIADIAGFEKLLKQNGIGRVVLSGSVMRRPDWRDIRPNLKALASLPRMLRRLVSGGDDALLKATIGLVEAQGCRVVGAHEVAPGLLAKAGVLGEHRLSRRDIADIEAGFSAARRLGELDVGQGAVSVGGRVVALEAAEGTDLMLERVAALRAQGRISARHRGVLVKCSKPQQEARADLPAIGPHTVENAIRAGLAGIAVEAGSSVVLEEERLLAAADAGGIFVVGFDAGLPRLGLDEVAP